MELKKHYDKFSNNVYSKEIKVRKQKEIWIAELDSGYYEILIISNTNYNNFSDTVICLINYTSNLDSYDKYFKWFYSQNIKTIDLSRLKVYVDIINEKNFNKIINFYFNKIKFGKQLIKIQENKFDHRSVIKNSINVGDIWFSNIGDINKKQGHEQFGNRPVIIVGSSKNKEYYYCFVISTKKAGKKYCKQVDTTNDMESWINCSQIVTVKRYDLFMYLHNVSQKFFEDLINLFLELIIDSNINLDSLENEFSTCKEEEGWQIAISKSKRKNIIIKEKSDKPYLII